MQLKDVDEVFNNIIKIVASISALKDLSVHFRYLLTTTCQKPKPCTIDLSLGMTNDKREYKRDKIHSSETRQPIV